MAEASHQLIQNIAKQRKAQPGHLYDCQILWGALGRTMYDEDERYVSGVGKTDGPTEADKPLLASDDSIAKLTITAKGKAVIKEVKDLMSKQQKRRYVVYTAANPEGQAWKAQAEALAIAEANKSYLIAGIHIEDAPRMVTWEGKAQYKTEMSITSVANISGKQLVEGETAVYVHSIVQRQPRNQQ